MDSLIIARPVTIPVVVPAIVFVVVIATTPVVTVTVTITFTYRVNLHEVSVVVDVNVVAHAALARVEAVRQARPFKADIIVSPPLQRLLSLVHGVRRLHERGGSSLCTWK